MIGLRCAERTFFFLDYDYVWKREREREREGGERGERGRKCVREKMSCKWQVWELGL